MSAPAAIRVVPEGAVAVVFLDRPPENRLDRAVVAELIAVVARLEADAAVRAVVVTGAGGAFSAGLDLAEWSGLTPREAQDAIQKGYEAFWALEHLTKPTLAAVEGICHGAGAELALACDFRVASEGATFAHPEVDLAWMPSHGGTARLARLVGRGRALELLLSGRRISAREAHEIGVVDVLTKSGGAVSRALELARAFAAKPRSSVRAIKRTLTEGEEKPYRNRFLLETQHSVQLLSSEEYRGAMARAKGKRP